MTIFTVALGLALIIAGVLVMNVFVIVCGVVVIWLVALES